MIDREHERGWSNTQRVRSTMPFKLSTVATIGLLCVARTEAWWLSPGLAKTATTRTSLHLETSRHDDHVEVTTSSSRRQWILETLKGGGTVATAASLISAGAAWQHRPAASWASGGATAGGVYLLSAKQRYNERVKAGTKGFAGLRPLIESGNVDGIRSYFASEDVGSWKDLSTAGYLLANAFRTNSSAAPDSLPSVKVRVAIRDLLPLARFGLVWARVSGFILTQHLLMVSLTYVALFVAEVEGVRGKCGSHDQGPQEEGHSVRPIRVRERAGCPGRVPRKGRALERLLRTRWTDHNLRPPPACRTYSSTLFLRLSVPLIALLRVSYVPKLHSSFDPLVLLIPASRMSGLLARCS